MHIKFFTDIYKQTALKPLNKILISNLFKFTIYS